jgi:hypothetical protein
MAILIAEHLFDQADKLAVMPGRGSPRQADMRRAISAAYYGVFHYCLTAAADEFVGVSHRLTGRYALVYRSIDHKTLKDVCIDVRKQTPPARYSQYIPTLGFSAEIREFAKGVIELQEKRHAADYNPRSAFSTSDARVAVAIARKAVSGFSAADMEQRKMFLTLLLCLPR